jgi:hypothetical protein
MRIEKEIPGASDSLADAPNLLELRKSNRRRQPKRQWPEVEATKPRKKQHRQLPTPNSTQNSTQTNSFTLYEDASIPTVEPAINEPTNKPSNKPSNEPTQASQRTKLKQEWELKYAELKRQSNQAARDYLLQLVGHDEFPEAMRLPTALPEVLIDEPFTLDDPLSI